MGKLTTFDICYDQPEGVFHAGAMLKGRVMVELREPMKIRKITLLIHGRAKVHWVKTRHGKNRSNTHYRAEEVYIRQNFLLWGSEEAQNHPAGTHFYEFHLPLAASLPSTFEGVHGYVRYFCKATIDRPWKFDFDTKSPFTVLSIVDLNTEPADYRTPVEGTESSSVDCCCCISGDVDATFSVNKRAFVPGEPITINATIRNNSNTDMEGSRVSIKQYIDFFGVSGDFFSSGNLKPKRESAWVATKAHGPIQAGKTDVWESEELRVPALPPSNLVGCNIINIFYVIKFYVSVNYGTDIKIASDIIIGTVPLRSSYGPPPVNTVVTQQPAAVPSAPGIPYDVPPPSYQESVLGFVNIGEEDDSEHTRGRLQYAPMYTYYNWDHMPPPPGGAEQPPPYTPKDNQV